MRSFWKTLVALPAGMLVALVRLYQMTLSHWVGRQCKFEPTCSQYFIEAVRKYGAFAGACRGVWRILRCNPWNAGGFDPP